METNTSSPAAPAAPPAEQRRTLQLSDGRTAELGKAKGRHLVKAAAASGGDNQFAVLIALVAQVATIDGARVTYEELQDMEAMDVLAMVGALLGNVPSLGLGI